MSKVKLEETENRRRLHIGSYFNDLNESEYQDLVKIFSKKSSLSGVKSREEVLSQFRPSHRENNDGVISVSYDSITVHKAMQEYADQQTAELKERVRELEAGLRNIVRSWDGSLYEREELKHSENAGGFYYWSPVASQVESQYIAAARKLLNKQP